jgi:hypothetical protein
MAVPEVPDEGAVRDRPNPVKAEALFPVAGPDLLSLMCSATRSSLTFPPQMYGNQLRGFAMKSHKHNRL